MAAHVLIAGSGIAGLASALALTKHLSIEPKVTIFEIRAGPQTIGGAVGLTPNALRCLDYLGVLQTIRARNLGANVSKIELFSIYDGRSAGVIDFQGPDGNGHGKPPYKGLRIMRSDLHQALLATAEQHANITISYGMDMKAIDESDTVSVRFADGSTLTGDVLLGCDGIHSQVRSLHVEPARQPKYTGIAAVFGFSPCGLEQRRALQFTDTGLYFSRRGSLLASFYDEARTSMLVGGVMGMADVPSRQGWQAKGKDQEAVRADMVARFCGTKVPCLDELVHAAADWALYPVYALPMDGKWSTAAARVVLLGDSAHAMPPQGESTGICIEDAVLFARFLGLASQAATNDYDEGAVMNVPLTAALRSACSAYEKYRRPVVDAAHRQATMRWETVKDSGWFAHTVKMWLTPFVIWMTSTAKNQSYAEDVSTVELKI